MSSAGCNKCDVSEYEIDVDREAVEEDGLEGIIVYNVLSLEYYVPPDDDKHWEKKKMNIRGRCHNVLSGELILHMLYPAWHFEKFR